MVAVTADKVVVELEAKIDRYNGRVNSSTRNFQRRMRDVERSATRAERSATTSFGRIAGAIFTAYTARQVQLFLDSATRIENALRIAGLEGEELSRVYDQIYASAQRNAAPFETLAILYGRAALAQKELGASTGDLLQFTEKVAVALRVSGKSAAETRGALIQLSQAVGAGIVRAEEFNAILEGALPIAQAAAAGLDEAGGSVAKLRTLIIDGKVSSEAFFRAFLAGSRVLDEKVANAQFTVEQGFIRLGNSAIDAAKRFDEAYGVTDELTEALGDMAETLDSVTDAFTDTESPLNKFLNKLIAVSDAVWAARGRVLEFFGLRGEGPDIETPDEAPGAPGPQETPQPSPVSAPAETVSLKDFPIDGDAEKKKANAFKTATREIEKQTAALEAQNSEMDKSTFAQVKAEEAARLLSAAQQAQAKGALEITPQVTAKIDELADAYARAKAAAGFESAFTAADEEIAALQREVDLLGMNAVEAEAMRFQQELLNEAMREFGQITPEVAARVEALTEQYRRGAQSAEDVKTRQQNLISVSDAARQGLIDIGTAGVRGFDSIGDAAKRALETFSQMVLELYVMKPLVESLFGQMGTTGTGSAGGILGNLFASGFASGTANTGGRRGEPRGVVHGQEAVIPLPAGGKVPVELRMPEMNMRAGGGGMGNVSVNTNVYVTRDGAQSSTTTNGDQEQSARRLASLVEQNTRATIQREMRQGGLLWNGGGRR